MFEKRKEAKEQRAQQLLNDRKQIEQRYDAAIKKADQIKDPAEKILALREIGQEIVGQIIDENAVISKKSISAKNKAYLAGWGPSMAGGLAITILVAGPAAWIGVPVALGGYAAAEALSSKREKSVKKKLEAASADHFNNLTDKLNLISKMTEATVTGNVKEIAKSPLYEQVVALPRLAQVFAAAAAKRIADQQQAPAAEEAPPASPKKPKQKPNYDKIKKVGGL